jgi:hypothetical protein
MALLVFSLKVGSPKKDVTINTRTIIDTVAVGCGLDTVNLVIDDVRVPDPQNAQSVPIIEALETLADAINENSAVITTIAADAGQAYFIDLSVPKGAILGTALTDVATDLMGTATGTRDVSLIISDPSIRTTGILYTTAERLIEYVLEWIK